MFDNALIKWQTFRGQNSSHVTLVCFVNAHNNSISFSFNNEFQELSISLEDNQETSETDHHDIERTLL